MVWVFGWFGVGIWVVWCLFVKFLGFVGCCFCGVDFEFSPFGWWCVTGCVVGWFVASWFTGFLISGLWFAFVPVWVVICGLVCLLLGVCCMWHTLRRRDGWRGLGSGILPFRSWAIGFVRFCAALACLGCDWTSCGFCSCVGWCNIVLRCSVVWCGVYVVGGVGA